MARETVVRITSDLTGAVYSGEDVPAVPVTVNGKKASLDLTPDDVAALAALIEGDHGAALRKLILTVSGATVAGKPGRKTRAARGGSHGADSLNKQIREWWGTPEARTALAIPDEFVIPERGRIPEDVKSAYEKRNAAA